MKLTKTKLNENILGKEYPELFDKLLSEKIYKEFIADSLEENCLFIVLGSDNGLLLNYLSGIKQKGQKFIVLEFSEMIHELIEHSPKLQEDFELVDITTFEFESLYDEDRDYVVRNATRLLKSISAEYEFSHYKDIFQQKNEEMRRFNMDRQDNRDYQSFYNVQFQNICDLQYPIKVLENKLDADIPAVIVGGGPSISHVLPWLKANQDKVWVFAASRVCKRLVQEGITPDFIGAVDYQDILFELSKDIYKFQDSSILLSGEHPGPKILSQWSGLKVYGKGRFPWHTDREENHQIFGPTIANSLFGMAAFLGAKKIYFTGVDLCFSKEGQSHESSSIEATSGVNYKFDTTVKNYCGEEVGTTIQFYDARNRFEEQVAFLKESFKGFSFFNFNKEAAEIDQIDVAELSSVNLNKTKFNAYQAFEPLIPVTTDSVAQYYKNLSIMVNKHVKWLKSLKNHAKSGLHLSNTLFENEKNKKQKIKQLIQKKNQIEKSLGVDYATFVQYGSSTFMETVKPVVNEDQMEEREIQDSLLGFFNGVNAAAEMFLTQMEGVKNKIDERKKELDPTIGFLELKTTWQQQGIPGRAELWLKNLCNKSNSDVPSVYAEEINELRLQFETLLSDDSGLQSYIESQRLNVETYIEELDSAYQKRQVIIVTQLSRQMAKVNQTGMDSVRVYAAALLLSLKNNQQEALNSLWEYDDNKHEYIQKRIYDLALGLNDLDKVVSALQWLCHHNVIYIPVFAQTMAVIGSLDKAIALYQAYPLIEQDTDAAINYLKLLVETGSVDLANEFLQKIDGLEAIDQAKLQSFVDSLNNPN